MDRRADIVAYSPDAQLQLVVEVKNRSGATADWAARLRRNLLVHDAIPAARYFLIAIPDQLFLWKDAPKGAEVPPDYTAPTRDVLRWYVGDRADGAYRPSDEGLQIVISSWLRDLAGSIRAPDPESKADRMLVDSGLYDAIRSGEIAEEAA